MTGKEKYQKDDFITECVMQVVKSGHYASERYLYDIISEEIYRDLYIREQMKGVLNEAFIDFKGIVERFKNIYSVIDKFLSYKGMVEQVIKMFQNRDYLNMLPTILISGFKKTPIGKK